MLPGQEHGSLSKGLLVPDHFIFNHIGQLIHPVKLAQDGTID